MCFESGIMNAKYLIFRDSADHVLIFCPTMSHAQIACDLGITNKIVGAGFIQFHVHGDGEMEHNPYSNGAIVKANCYGQSDSLKIAARNEDSEIVNRFINR